MAILNLFYKASKEDPDELDTRYLHRLKQGDHVVRWTRLVVYPIQVHGIVLSASDDVVTIVDFGLTALPSDEEKRSASYMKDEGIARQSNDCDAASFGGIRDRNDGGVTLEETVNHEDRAMMKACEEHRHEIQGPDRINILVLTEAEDIKQWKKVEYAVEGGKKNSKRKFQWWFGNNNENDSKATEKNVEEKIIADDINNNDEQRKKVVMETEKNDEQDSTEKSIVDKATIEVGQISDESTTEMPQKEQKQIDEKESTTTATNDNEIRNGKKFTESKILKDGTISSKENQIVPTLKQKNGERELPESLKTRSDPTNIVIARVRYLVSNPHVLPPHNIFYSNSGMLHSLFITKMLTSFEDTWRIFITYLKYNYFPSLQNA